MRGVIGLALIVIGASMAWLIILGKFPPHKQGTGLLGVFQQYQQGSNAK